MEKMELSRFTPIRKWLVSLSKNQVWFCFKASTTASIGLEEMKDGGFRRCNAGGDVRSEFAGPGRSPIPSTIGGLVSTLPSWRLVAYLFFTGR